MTDTDYKLIKRVFVYHDAYGFDERTVINAIDSGWITVDAIGQLFHTSKGVAAVKTWIAAGKPTPSTSA